LDKTDNGKKNGNNIIFLTMVQIELVFRLVPPGERAGIPPLLDTWAGASHGECKPPFVSLYFVLCSYDYCIYHLLVVFPLALTRALGETFTKKMIRETHKIAKLYSISSLTPDFFYVCV